MSDVKRVCDALLDPCVKYIIIYCGHSIGRAFVVRQAWSNVQNTPGTYLENCLIWNEGEMPTSTNVSFTHTFDKFIIIRSTEDNIVREFQTKHPLETCLIQM